MATTVTIQPTGVYYKYETGKWEYAQRLWDGNESSAPTKQSGAIILLLDLSFLPTGTWITQVTARYVFKRGGSTMNTISLCCTDDASYVSPGPTRIKEITLPKGTYNVAETHAGTVTLTPAESQAFLSKAYQLISIPYMSGGTGYEVYVDVTYEESESNLFVGAAQAKEVYVGTEKARAVYVGDKKIL